MTTTRPTKKRLRKLTLVLVGTLIAWDFTVDFKMTKDYFNDAASRDGFYSLVAIDDDNKSNNKNVTSNNTSNHTNMDGKSGVGKRSNGNETSSVSAWILPSTCQLHYSWNMRRDVGEPEFRKFPKRIDRIHLLHMRKAGGSSFRRYFKEIAAKYNLTFSANEGKKIPEMPGTDPHTLYITHLREPISRAISHYKYEFRWPCPLLKDESFVPTENNTSLSLYEFATHDYPTNRSQFWKCNSNCFARWISGMHPRKNFSNPHDVYNAVLLQKARELFHQYDVVIVQEWLDDPIYLAELEYMFGHPQLDRHVGAFCSKYTRKANKMVPLVVEDRAIQALIDKNSVDIALYKELTSCKPNFNVSQYLPWLNGSKAKPDNVFNWRGRFGE